MSNIKELRSNPSLQDIPAQLRALADAISSGEYGEVDSLYVVMPKTDDWPTIFGYGDVDGDNQPIVVMELAKSWFVNNMTSRRA